MFDKSEPETDTSQFYEKSQSSSDSDSEVTEMPLPIIQLLYNALSTSGDSGDITRSEDSSSIESDRL